MELTKRFLPLNIQLFAEGDDGGAEENVNKNAPKTYTEEDVKALMSKVNAENKKYKQQLQEKMTEEEKNKALQDEQQEAHNKIVLENRQLKLSLSLAKGGFNEQEIKEITDLITGDDDIKFANYLCKMKQTIIENAKKEAENLYSKQNYVPGGKQGEGSDEESYASKIAKKLSDKTTEKKSWGQFNN